MGSEDECMLHISSSSIDLPRIACTSLPRKVVIWGYTLEEIDAIFAISFNPFHKSKDQVDAINRTRITISLAMDAQEIVREGISTCIDNVDIPNLEEAQHAIADDHK